MTKQSTLNFWRSILSMALLFIAWLVTFGPVQKAKSTEGPKTDIELIEEWCAKTHKQAREIETCIVIGQATIDLEKGIE